MVIGTDREKSLLEAAEQREGGPFEFEPPRMGERQPVDISRCRFCRREASFLFLDEQGAYCGEPDCESHILAEERLRSTPEPR